MAIRGEERRSGEEMKGGEEGRGGKEGPLEENGNDDRGLTKPMYLEIL